MGKCSWEWLELLQLQLVPALPIATNPIPVATASSTRNRIARDMIFTQRFRVALLMRLPSTPSAAIMIDPALVKCQRKPVLACMLGCM
jgi:hypothetical protein